MAPSQDPSGPMQCRESRPRTEVKLDSQTPEFGTRTAVLFGFDCDQWPGILVRGSGGRKTPASEKTWGTRRGDILVPLFAAVAFAGPRRGRSWADRRGDFQSPRGSGGRKTPTPFHAGFRRTGAGGGAPIVCWGIPRNGECLRGIHFKGEGRWTIQVSIRRNMATRSSLSTSSGSRPSGAKCITSFLISLTWSKLRMKVARSTRNPNLSHRSRFARSRQ